MDFSFTIIPANSHTLHFDSNSNSVLGQSAGGDGSQAEIITMDSSVYKAAADGDIHALHQLPDIDLQEQLSPKRNSVLHIAAQFHQLRTVQWILEFPWNSSLLQKQNLKGDTPLHLGAREGHLLVVKALCDAAKLLPLGHESGISAEKAMLRSTNKEGNTALHEAVRYNRCEVVKLLIKEDPDLFAYAENNSGATPLYLAAERGFRKLVEIIIENSRTSPAYSGFNGRTALHAAVIKNDTEMTKKILEWKPALTKEVDENGWSPLHCAAFIGCNTRIIKELLDKSDRSAPYLRIKDGNLTALHMAARHGHTKIVEMLASHFPDCCEQVDGEGNNVFHCAVMSKKPCASSDLLKNRWLRGSELINEKNGGGDTPLHLINSLFVHDPQLFYDDNADKMALDNHRSTAFDIYLKAHDTCHCTDALVGYYGEKRVLACTGPKWWFRKENSDSSGSQSNESGNNNGRCRGQGASVFMKRRSETHLVVATLIATVTFAAGFTLPGGYNQSNGMAMLSKKAAFKAFVVMDTMAMVLSVSAVFNYLFMSLHGRRPLLDRHIIRGFFLTMFALAAMVIAFLTGLYAVVPHPSRVPIFICAICGCFFLFFCFTCRQFLRKARVWVCFDKGNHVLHINFHW